MNIELKGLLERHAMDYTLVPSKTVPNNSGLIIAIENYYPHGHDENINLSIALSSLPETWEPKCWLSKYISNDDVDKPSPNLEYSEFNHNQIQYYPYSIKTDSYSLLDVFELCDGLYRFVKEGHIAKNE